MILTQQAPVHYQKIRKLPNLLHLVGLFLELIDFLEILEFLECSDPIGLFTLTPSTTGVCGTRGSLHSDEGETAQVSCFPNQAEGDGLLVVMDQDCGEKKLAPLVWDLKILFHSEAQVAGTLSPHNLHRSYQCCGLTTRIDKEVQPEKRKPQALFSNHQGIQSFRLFQKDHNKEAKKFEVLPRKHLTCACHTIISEPTS